MIDLLELPSEETQSILGDGLRLADELLASAPSTKLLVIANALDVLRSKYAPEHIDTAIYHVLQQSLSIARENGIPLTLEMLTERLADEDSPVGNTIQKAVFDEALRSYENHWETDTPPLLEQFFPILPDGAVYDELGAELLQSFLEVFGRATSLVLPDCDLLFESWRQLSNEMRQRYSKGYCVTYRLPLPGQTIGTGYLLDSIAGVGGMSVVYRAMHRAGFRVALKMLRPDCPARERFVREAKDTVQLHDICFVVLKDADLSPTTEYPYYTMNFVDGGWTLHELWESNSIAKQSLMSFFQSHSEGGMPSSARYQRKEALFLRALIHICQGLHRLHAAGFIHCDLKPGNILLSQKNGPLISDFGLARHYAEDISNAEAFSGTPEYASPEQVSGQELTPSSDIYQMGAILYRGITESAPFHGRTVSETLEAVLHQPLTAPSQLNDDIDKDLEAICLKALERDPAKRYRTALDFSEDLKRYLQYKPVRARSGFALRNTVYYLARSVLLWTLVTTAIIGLCVWHWLWLTTENIHGSVASQNRYQHPGAAIKSQAVLENRAQWPSPNYSDVLFIRSSILFDLADWKPIPPGTSPATAGRVEPSYMTRVVDLVLKENPLSPKKEVVFQYRTEGADAVFNCSTHPYVVHGSKDPTSLGGSTAATWVREITIDLSAEPRGKEIRVVVHGMSWNGFQAKNGKTWAGFLAPEGLSVGELAVRFPKHRKPQRMPGLYLFPLGNLDAVRASETQNFYAPTSEDWWVWRPGGILPNHVYKMEWHWDD